MKKIIILLFVLVLATGVLANPDSKIDRISKAYGSSLGSAKWNPEADLNNDGIVNVYDLALASKGGTITSSYSTLQGGTTLMSVEPENTFIDFIGKNFSIDINVTDALATYAFEFKLSWNNYLLNLTDFTNGTFLSNGGETYCSQDVNYTEGWLLFGCTLLEPAISQTGNGTLATLNFTALNYGNSLLDLYDTYLLDDNLNSYAHESRDGNVVSDITPPTIIIISPANNTSYYKVSIPLNFTIDEPTSWIAYSLNNTQNINITGNTNLTGIANGWNNVTVFANDTFGNMGSNTTYFFYCQGDITGDKKIDGKDIAFAAKYFGTLCGDGKYNSTADLNDDCKIDGRDITVVAKYFGKVC